MRAMVLAPLAALGACVSSTADRLETLTFAPAPDPLSWTEAATDALPAASEPLTVMTWNIGYGGLGADADFIAEGGRRLRPRSAEQVRANISGVVRELQGRRPHLVLMQELGGPGLLTRNIDVTAAVRAGLPGYRMDYAPDVASRLWPGSIRITHGPATFARVRIEGTKTLDLPDEPHALAYLVERNYRGIVTDMEVDGRPWTFVNVHLAAYENSGARERQLRAILDYAQARWREGRAVVVGGDFNMELRDTAFASTRPRPGGPQLTFPRHLMPLGWSILADAGRPSVRSKDGPYVPGESFTTIIDGFLASPNVRLASIGTIDTGFAHTDHQPVLATFAWATP